MPHPDLQAAQALAYAPCGYSVDQLQPALESADYAACTLRVYPPWDTNTSRQAQRTQAWQLRYFVDMSEGRAVDLARVKALLALQG